MKDLTRWGIVEEGAVTASGHDEILYRFRTQAEAKNMLRWYYPDRRQRRWLRRDDGGTARDLREAVPGGPGGEVDDARRRGSKAGERTLGGRRDRRGDVRRRFAEVEHPRRRGNEFVSGRRLASGPGLQARGAGHTRANRGGHRRSAAAAEAGSFGKVSPA